MYLFIENLFILSVLILFYALSTLFKNKVQTYGNDLNYITISFSLIYNQPKKCGSIPNLV